MSLANTPLVAGWIGLSEGRLLVRSGKVDIGQRISTALMQIAHEELSVPLDQIDMAPVRTGPSPDEGMTSGSNSLEQSGNAIRRAAATLRRELIALAIARFGGDESGWMLESGVLHLAGTNHRMPVTGLMPELDPGLAVDPQAPVSARKGRAPVPPMRGLSDMVRGRFTYVQDLEQDGMLHARVIRPPHARASLISIAGTAVDRLATDGLHLVRDGNFLAIAGPKEWPVVCAALAVQDACIWDRGAGLPETDIFTQLNARNAQRLPVVDGVPRDAPVAAPLADADYAARYERPYQMHGALGPSAAMAMWDGGMLTLHSQSQGIYPLRASIAESLGLAENQVDITHVPGSGCYGHNGADDAAFEAALIAMALAQMPILLKWTREDEHGWEPYAPAMAVEVAAELKGGQVAQFSAEAYSDTHRGRPRPGPNKAGPAKLLANRFRAAPLGPPAPQPNMGRHAGIHRNLDPIYGFADKRLVKNLVPGLPHRTSAMRCLGAAANVFAIESSMDALAGQAGAEPLEFRRRHLSDPRALAVLDRLEQHASARATSENGGRGFAYAQYKNQMTRVGLCVDLFVDDRAQVRLDHVIIVADAGRIVDAEGLTAQMEGGVIQAASWALYEQVTWNREGILSRDWDSYPVIRFDNIPTFAVTLLDQPAEASAGAGEASSGPAIAAIANAIFAATGIRVQRMPFTPDAIRTQALRAEP